MKEIVIKIPEEIYNSACATNNTWNKRMAGFACSAIANGKVLPRGHGKIGDVTELQKTFHNLCDAYGIDNLSFISDMDMNFDLIPNLVEADRRENEQQRSKRKN